MDQIFQQIYSQGSPSKGLQLKRQRSNVYQQQPSIYNDFISDQDLEYLAIESKCSYLSNNPKVNRSHLQIKQICSDFQMQMKDLRTPGLGNMGNTCFANSVLQCLTNTPQFQLYALKGLHSQKCTSKMNAIPLMMINPVGALTSQMFLRSAIVQQVLNNEKFCSMCILEAHTKQLNDEKDRGTKFVYPLSSIILIKKVAQGLFEVGRQCDASEFLLCLLENLIQSSFGYINNVPFKLQRETIVSKIFQGMLERQIICCSCNNMTTIEEAFLDLSLNLNINQNLSSHFSQNSSQTQPVDLLDCISEFFKTDTLDEQNKYHCQSCGRLTKAQTRFRMKNLPRVLIVHLKRFTHLGTKLKTPLNFPEFFSFDSDYILDNMAMLEQKHAYKLYAIIVHQGYSAHKGHYYSYIRPNNQDNWYKYDDESVKLIENIETQMLSTQKAYILFYQKVKTTSSPQYSRQTSPIKSTSFSKSQKQSSFNSYPSKSTHPEEKIKIKPIQISPKKQQSSAQKLQQMQQEQIMNIPQPVIQQPDQQTFDEFHIQLTDTSSHEYGTRRKNIHTPVMDDPEDLLRKQRPTKISIQMQSQKAIPIKKGPNAITKRQDIQFENIKVLINAKSNKLKSTSSQSSFQKKSSTLEASSIVSSYLPQLITNKKSKILLVKNNKRPQKSNNKIKSNNSSINNSNSKKLTRSNSYQQQQQESIQQPTKKTVNKLDQKVYYISSYI